MTLEDLKIRTKEKRLVRFTPNPVQILYLDMLANEVPGFNWRAGRFQLRGVREDILKARQEGMSTLWLALYFMDTINNPLTQSVIIAHDMPSTERLFKTVHRFWENLPPQKRRPKKYSNKRELEFLDNESSIMVATAGTKGAGRGGTLNNLHLSEAAFWPSNETEIGLFEAVPPEGNITRETTANGLNHYYEERQRQHRGESNFRSRFFGWHLNPEYTVSPVSEGFEPDEEERKLAEIYALSQGQLEWRRRKRLDLKEKFEQEYPIHEDEAFLTSGNPYFSREVLTELRHRLETSPEERPSKREILAAIPREWDRLRQAVELERLEVFQWPEAEAAYVIGADTAEGLTGAGNHDYDAADVLECGCLRQVAHLHGRWDTHEYGLLLAELGRWYNTALLGVERNNHGHAVLNALLNDARYPQAPHDFTRGVYFHLDYDERQKPVSRRPGWPTTKSTKSFALDCLKTALNEGELQLGSIASVGELLRYIHLPGGRAGAEGSGHDDRVMSLAIAVAMAQVRPRTKGMLEALRKRYTEKLGG